MKSPLSLFINNLSFSYKNREIFNNFNYSVSFNNILLIKGDIGSGKSTLLKLIYGFYEPNNGKIFIESNDNCLISKYFIHSNSVFNFVTGFISDEMRLLGITDLDINLDLSKHVSEYSGGELKKIAVKMGLTLNSKLILMDEPFEMLDDLEVINVRDAILDSFKKSNDRYMIIATHEELLDNFADEILYLR